MAVLLTHMRRLAWRSFFRPRWLLVAGALCGVLLIGAALGLRVLRSGIPEQVLPGQILATDIVQAALKTPGVGLTSGAYFPGDGFVFYSRIADTDQSRVRTWTLLQLEPFADRLSNMPKKEQIRWIIDYGPGFAAQEVIVAPVIHADNPKQYQYVSADQGKLLTVTQTLPLGAAETHQNAATSVAVPAQAIPIQPTAQAIPIQPTAQAIPIQPTVAVQAAPATNPVVQPVVPVTRPVGGPLLQNTFEGSGTSTSTGPNIWLPLSGDWQMGNGIYSQKNLGGYDFITMANVVPQGDYRFETRLRINGGTMGGGLIYNAPDRTVRAGAQIVDLDVGGSFLRSGHYDAQGAYIFEDGAAIDPPLNDGQWHTLSLEVQADQSIVKVDDRQIGVFKNSNSPGYIGLTTSQAEVDFDDVQITELSQGNRPVTPPDVTEVPQVSSDLSDDFNDGNALGWNVINGVWQVIDNEYQQTATNGFDLGSVSGFEGDSYVAQAEMRYIDGNMGSGFYFNMAERNSKNRSQIVKYTQEGKAIQWGHFDDGGNFVFEGSVEVPDGSDGEWHTLELLVQDAQATITLDDEVIAKEIPLTYSNGYVGLIASASTVAFDNVQITAK